MRDKRTLAYVVSTCLTYPTVFNDKYDSVCQRDLSLSACGNDRTQYNNIAPPPSETQSNINPLPFKKRPYTAVDQSSNKSPEKQQAVTNGANQASSLGKSSLAFVSSPLRRISCDGEPLKKVKKDQPTGRLQVAKFASLRNMALRSKLLLRRNSLPLTNSVRGGSVTSTSNLFCTSPQPSGRTRSHNSASAFSPDRRGVSPNGASTRDYTGQFGFGSRQPRWVPTMADRVQNTTTPTQNVGNNDFDLVVNTMLNNPPIKRKIPPRIPNNLSSFETIPFSGSYVVKKAKSPPVVKKNVVQAKTTWWPAKFVEGIGWTESSAVNHHSNSISNGVLRRIHRPSEPFVALGRGNVFDRSTAADPSRMQKAPTEKTPDSLENENLRGTPENLKLLVRWLLDFRKNGKCFPYKRLLWRYRSAYNILGNVQTICEPNDELIFTVVTIWKYLYPTDATLNDLKKEIRNPLLAKCLRRGSERWNRYHDYYSDLLVQAIASARTFCGVVH